MNIQIRQQRRKSLAFRVTANGAIVLVPYNVPPDSQQVKAFVAEALAKMPLEPDEASSLHPNDICQLVETWQERLNVSVRRLQIRTMRKKMGFHFDRRHTDACH
jgi:predicted metal-dependent hydrolase